MNVGKVILTILRHWEKWEGVKVRDKLEKKGAVKGIE